MRKLTVVLIFLTGLGAIACSSDTQEPTIEPCRAPLVLCGNSCVDLQTDRFHCSECDRSCGAEERCREGVCGCEEGLLSCDGLCVDSLADENNCGGCGKVCSEGEICSEGSCAPACPDGGKLCATGCKNLDTDAENCGACGKSCEPGESCVDGECSPCVPGQTFCSNACRDLDTDSSHCGECGNACGEDETCVDGSCACAEGLTRCGTACVDTNLDDDHCGGCDVSCATGPRAMGYCDAGSCVYLCEEGWDNCSGDWTEGCNVFVRDVFETCGSCDNHCGTKENTTAAVCSGLACFVVTCEPGWGDCDENGDNGCETDLLESVNHCGACGQSCEDAPNTVASSPCVDGRCDFECEEGWADCDGLATTGCEARLDSDPETCGACDVSCTDDEFCAEGSCLNPRWAQWPLPSGDEEDRFVYETGSPTVFDNATGLEWTRNVPAAMDGFEAVEHCASEIAGKEDWRLPSLMELLTLVDPSRSYPAIDTDAFPRTPQTYFWSADAQNASTDWVIDFETGFTVGASRTSGLRVRCVRGGRGQSGPRYEVHEHWVVDPRTKLQWQRAVLPSRHNWEDAQTACASLEVDGVTGWRLPSRLELFTLSDILLSDPAIDEDAFPDTPSGAFWAADSYHPNPDSAWTVSFYVGGFSIHQGKSVESSVRCVRSLP